MASHTKITRAKRRQRAHKAGRKRKNQQGRRSTVSVDEMFAKCGEPGQPAPTATP